jgi:hypothetical protein
MKLKLKFKKINLVNLALTAVIFAVLAQIIHSLFSFAGMGYYTNSKYFSIWSRIMMPGPGPPPVEFFYYSVGFGVITAVIYTFVYLMLKESIPGKHAVSRGLNYGFYVLWLLGTVPNTLALYLLVSVPAGLILLWAFENLFVALLGGYVIARLNK